VGTARNERPVDGALGCSVQMDVAPGGGKLVLLASGAALPTGALEHLLVLLLAHPLAALLDQ
jgi:hypothetical protein